MINFKAFLSELHKPKEISSFKDRVSHMKSVDSREPQAWQGTLPDLMSQYGFKQVGDGKYGTVFLHPSYQFAVKVFMKDTAYLKWLNFSKENQNNPWVPKIKDKVIRINDLFMAVRLEKLTTFKGNGSEDMLYSAMKNGDAHAKKVVDFLEDNDKLLDWHDGNVMMRSNQLVVIDPFYNWYKGGRFTISPDETKEFKNILLKP